LSTSQHASTRLPGRPVITLIAAVATNGTIGLNNELPWHLPEDLKRFKALTLGHPVIMGRKTFDSIVARLGKPLPGRRNLVISRSQRSGMVGAEYYASLDAALAACRDVDEVFVIGGEQIYVIALPLAGRLQLTEVKADIAGDAFFPAHDRSLFRETARMAGAGGDHAYDFVTYERAS
jgi:dihydrofolate reductase